MENPHLINLLLSPVENLAYEHKTWVDIEDKAGMAKVAVAAIALANHGGGFLILGMHTQPDKSLASAPRPDGIKRYTPDSMARAINHFAEPEVIFNFEYVDHPTSGVEHVVVHVQASHVPIMSRKGHDKEIAQGAFYIRKPGPKSEQPSKAEEWRTLINRCVRGERESLIAAIRDVVTGVTSLPPAVNRLDEFEVEAGKRWDVLLTQLPPDSWVVEHPGHCTFVWDIEGIKGGIHLAQLRETLRNNGYKYRFEWTPFGETNMLVDAPHAYGDVLDFLWSKCSLGRCQATCTLPKTFTVSFARAGKLR